jgi:hypothetical protein
MCKRTGLIVSLSILLSYVPSTIEVRVLPMPRKQEMVALGEAQSLRPRVEFSEGLEARVVDRRIPPPRWRLGPSN